MPDPIQAVDTHLCSRLTSHDDVQVDPSKLNVLAAWKHNYTLETVLVELRR